MKQEYNKKKPVEKGGKRIGKSLPSKTAGFAKRKSTAPRTVKTEDSEKHFSSTEKKKVYRKPKSDGIKNIPKKPNPTGEMRLNRFIANAGICSRREADTYIAAGMVAVNGKIITELGVKVLPEIATPLTKN